MSVELDEALLKRTIIASTDALRVSRLFVTLGSHDAAKRSIEDANSFNELAARLLRPGQKCGLRLEFKWCDVKAGTFEAYGSTFDSEPDCVGDVVKPGAFKRSVDEKGGSFPLLYAHDHSQLIGIVQNAHEDSKGLRFTGRLNLQDDKAAHIHDLMKAGALREFSIGYTTRKSKLRNDGVRELHDVQLHEISSVVAACNTNAQLI